MYFVFIQPSYGEMITSENEWYSKRVTTSLLDESNLFCAIYVSDSISICSLVMYFSTEVYVTYKNPSVVDKICQ